jgi:hypothetical protein
MNRGVYAPRAYPFAKVMVGFATTQMVGDSDPAVPPFAAPMAQTKM